MAKLPGNYRKCINQLNENTAKYGDISQLNISASVINCIICFDVIILNLLLIVYFRLHAVVFFRSFQSNNHEK